MIQVRDADGLKKGCRKGNELQEGSVSGHIYIYIYIFVFVVVLFFFFTKRNCANTL
jgi:hypothetical protein